MGLGERDLHTGHMTTGHEWDGIRELNTRVPRPVYIFLALAALFSLVYWVLMPAWPLGSTYTRGLLGVDERRAVVVEVERAAAARAAWTRAIEAASFAEIQADPALMQATRASGNALFGDNCAACHGTDAKGGTGFPDLTDASWLWGGDPETIAETLRVGINSTHPEARSSQMLAFGRDQLLSRAEILAVVDYVRSLSQPKEQEIAAPTLAVGATLFAENCASCHGADGSGDPELGAPNLTDGFWLYGGDRQSVFTTVFSGRQGHMPQWEDRLTPVERKILTLYLIDLGEGRR